MAIYPKEEKPKKKEVFETKPKEPKKAKAIPKKGEKDEEGVFDETKGKIKEGGLRKALKVDKDYKFTRPKLTKLLKLDDGAKFDFEDNQFKMTDSLKKKIQLAVNMMK